MSKTAKKSAEVVKAEEALIARIAELDAARAEVDRLQVEVSKANLELREARISADSLMSQCDCVRLAWRSGHEVSRTRLVIVKRTPGGQLVTRPAGEALRDQKRWKWRDWANAYVPAEKQYGLCSDSYQLRNVPAEFMPDGATA